MRRIEFTGEICGWDWKTGRLSINIEDSFLSTSDVCLDDALNDFVNKRVRITINLLGNEEQETRQKKVNLYLK